MEKKENAVKQEEKLDLENTQAQANTNKQETPDENVKPQEIPAIPQEQSEDNSSTLPSSETPQENSEIAVAPVAPQQNYQAKPKDELVAKVDTIKSSLESVYRDYKKVLDEFEVASLALAEQENKILNATVKETLELLEKLHVPSLELDNVNDTIANIKLDNKKEILEVKYPSKGRFKGFFLGTLTTVAALAGLGVYGAKMANLPLTPETFMQKANLDTIVSKYLELLNIKMPVINGYALLGAASLILGFIVYKFTTLSQKIKNKKYVARLEENAKEYQAELLEQTEELKKVIEQIEQIQELNEKYDILLQEQNAKLKRILFFEKPQEFDDLNPVSKVEVEKTQLLLKELVNLMNTPVLKDDKLNADSIRNFQSAQTTLEEALKKLY